MSCQRHPLFIYFNKQSFSLIIHDNACLGWAYLRCPSCPGLMSGPLCVVTTHTACPAFLEVGPLSPARGDAAEGWQVRAYPPPLSGAKETGGERQRGPRPRSGTPSTNQAGCWPCPESAQARWWFSHPPEEKMGAWKSPVAKLTFECQSDSKPSSATLGWRFLGRKPGRGSGAKTHPLPACTADHPICSAFSPFPGLSSNYHHPFRQLSKVFLVLAESWLTGLGALQKESTLEQHAPLSEHPWCIALTGELHVHGPLNPGSLMDPFHLRV